MTRRSHALFRRSGAPLALAAAALLLNVSPAAAQADFQWRGRLPAGQTLEIKGVMGAIRAELASGDQIEVTGRRSARRSDPADVTFEVVEHAGGVTICAVYPSPNRGRGNECAPGDGGRMSTQNNDVSVEFTVRVPRGVAFAARTVNGDVDARRLESDVIARTVNGSIEIGTTGLARAATVNGSITARMGAGGWSDRLEFETVSGSITIEAPPSLSANVEASTVNGAITTDFPLQVQGRFNSRRLQGTIGGGGRSLQLKTVNGEIRLRRTS